MLNIKNTQTNLNIDLVTNEGTNYSNNAWHFTDDNYSINVAQAWEYYNGNNIRVGVVDTGFTYSQNDFINYDITLDYDYAGQDSDSVRQAGDDSHGDNVMTLIGAASNNEDSLGVAHGATLVGYRVDHGDGYSVWDAATGAIGNNDVHILNNSWGPLDSYTWNAYDYGLSQAFFDAEQNRGGLGQIVIFSAGNDRSDNSITDISANAYGLSSAINTLTVGALNDSGVYANFSQAGSSLLVTAPGQWVPTNVNGTSVELGSGTSYSAPIVSGVAALMLDANESLSWRDVQEILALTSKKVELLKSTPSVNNWEINGVTNWNGGGNLFNNDYGFGLVDASAAVRMAENWNVVQNFSNMDQTNVADSASYILNGVEGATLSVNFNIVDNINIEMITLDASISMNDLSNLRIEITSPSGTTSELMGYTQTDDTNVSWTYKSNAFWGESSIGTWTVKFTNTDTIDGISNLASSTISGLDLYVYGGTDTSNTNTYYFTDQYSDFINDGNHLLNIGANSQAGNVTINASAVSTAVIGNLSDFNSYSLQIDGVNVTLDNVLTDNIYTKTITEYYFGGGDDQFTDHNASSSIFGGFGNDTINGFGGDDSLYGGVGSDILIGGSGSDTINGGIGSDRLYGGNQNDLIRGEAGNDRILGEHGNDIILGGDGNDALFGNTGGDRLYGDNGNDYINGGSSSDLIRGGNDNDTLVGGSGNDFITGDNGDDNLYGGDNNDRLYGGIGSDLLKGEAGNDRLIGENGHDILSGGAGDDVLFGDNGGDRLYGGDGNDRLHGGASNDLLKGQKNDDQIYGDDGNDIIYGGDGSDILDGGAGNDIFVFLTGESGYDNIIGYSKSDDLIDINSYLSTVGLSNNASAAINNNYLVIQQNSLDVAIYFDELGNGNLTDQICLVENTLISQIDATCFV